MSTFISNNSNVLLYRACVHVTFRLRRASMPMVSLCRFSIVYRFSTVKDTHTLHRKDSHQKMFRPRGGGWWSRVIDTISIHTSRIQIPLPLGHTDGHNIHGHSTVLTNSKILVEKSQRREGLCSVTVRFSPSEKDLLYSCTSGTPSSRTSVRTSVRSVSVE